VPLKVFGALVLLRVWGLGFRGWDIRDIITSPQRITEIAPQGPKKVLSASSSMSKGSPPTNTVRHPSGLSLFRTALTCRFRFRV
jgi:hypothetical protein